MALLDQIEDFQATMDKVLELVEETKVLAGQIEDTPPRELPAKMKIIFEFCSDGINKLNQAIGEAEDIQKTVGG
ncbi:hypothetical protein [Planktothrix agardhii]|uniref:hypothetical protein n=1 Tax=Planktothrix agardhii TaxID=1160 RepID=UPI0003FEAEF0|nr:hypothetical protein [Planktothrix agardhii]CAD0232195.1 hypothetical protein PL10110_700036 [Planktothrix agardhii]